MPVPLVAREEENGDREHREPHRRLGIWSPKRKVEVARPVARRRPKLILIGVALVLGCGLLGGEMASRAGRMGSYLALARPLLQGERLRAGDLVELAMRAGSSNTAIPLQELTSYLGKPVAASLPVGTVLVPTDFLSSSPPKASTALVGTSLQADQAPTNLVVGDDVWVVTTAGGNAASVSSGQPNVLARGTVFAIVGGAGTSSPSSGQLQVSVAVPITDGPSVASASASGQISLIEVPVGATRGSEQPAK